VYVLEKEVLNYMSDEGYSDFAYDIFPKLMELNIPIYGYVLKHDDYLIDIGSIDNYKRVNEDIRAGRVRVGYGQ
ncbi:hypothetical protein ACFLUO_04200, partial [Chloroflexota bacterium]